MRREGFRTNSHFTRRKRSERLVCNHLLGRAQHGLIAHR